MGEKRQARQGADVLLQEEPLRFQTRKQVGLLGGNFNPVHLAHLVMADQVQNQLGLDKVYLMPTYLPPHVDEKKTISSEHRLAMLELAVADNPCLDIEPIELIRKGKSYTYDTMKALKEANPDTDYYFIIGGDMVEYLPKWHRIDDLLHLVQFVGIRRPNYPTESTYPIIWVDVPQMAISSTLIRQKVKSGCSIRYLLPENVINYIQEKMSWITNYDAAQRELLMQKVQMQMSERRFRHVLGVEETAVALAAKYGADEAKASIAALTHDYAKERPNDEFELIIRLDGFDLALLNYGNEIWHGLVGADIVQRELAIDDEEILQAIRVHTTGAAKMSLLDKIIYVADYIEPGRDFPGVKEAREIALVDLDAAVAYETKHTLLHLIEQEHKIYPKTLETYNQWVVNQK